MTRQLLALTTFILLILFSHWRESATEVRPSSDIEFSAINAYKHLEEIAQKPHPIGSIENQRVRDYLVKTMKGLGLTTEIMTGYTRTSWKPTYNKMAYIENVVATLPGSDPDAKQVIIAGHYDSVVEGPGAADDGYSVASMIETARLLKNQNLKNDIIFLITDGEEYGLLGAQYYVENNSMDDVGLVLNYEARGASGPGIAFEWSPNNAWLVDEMQKCYRRPIANSLSYEIYKRMPNGSDFSEFMLKNIPGINHAFIDGFSYYHHPQDDLDHVSKNSIQHTGENMYLAAKHFGNFDFGSVPQPQYKGGDASFFNFFGFLFAFSSMTNMVWYFLSLLLMVIAIYRHRKDKKVTVKNVLVSTLLVLGLILLIGGLGFGLSVLIKSIYPQYSTFYSHHWYNHEWYFIAGVGMSILILGLLAKRLITSLGSNSIGVGTMIVLASLSTLILTQAPSGAYIMTFPLLALAGGMLDQSFVDEDSGWHFGLGLASLAIFIGFWTFFSHVLYLAFSLTSLPAAIIPCTLFGLASIALVPSIWKSKLPLMAILGGAIFLVSLIGAHILSTPTSAKPLKSNLSYVYEGETDETFVSTSDKHINDGHLGLFSNADAGRLPSHLQFSRFFKESNVDQSKYKSEVFKTEVTNKLDRRTFKMKHPKHASMVHLIIKDIANIDSLLIDGVLNKDFKGRARDYYYSPMFGIGLDSIEVTIIPRNDSKIQLYMNVEYGGLPTEDELPSHIIRNDGSTYISHFIEI